MSTLSDLSRINLKIFHSFIFHSFSRGRGGKVNDTIFTLFGFFFILTSSLYHCLYYQRHCGPESYDSPQTGQHPAQHQAGSGHGTNSLVDGPLNKTNIIETSRKSSEIIIDSHSRIVKLGVQTTYVQVNSRRLQGLKKLSAILKSLGLDQ